MKHTYIALGVVLIAAGVGYFVMNNYSSQSSSPIATIKPCTKDVLMCPDGTSVPRSGPDCKFGVCKQILPDYLAPTPQSPRKESVMQKELGISGISQTAVDPLVSTSLLTDITQAVISFFTQPVDSTQPTVTSGTQTTSNTPDTTTTNTPVLNDIRYLVIRNNTLVDQNNNVIYTFPSSFTSSSGSMVNNFINAVAVNTVAPVIGAIPVDGQNGKYYLSENSIGTTGECQFSNKIYILDTLANTKTLLYEENSTTLSHTDSRACNSEIYLLATEGEKLILKYHTIGTNMVCDSTWSEPEKTWYLDVTKTLRGTNIYPISPTRYAQAESYETACREELATATTTP